MELAERAWFGEESAEEVGLVEVWCGEVDEGVWYGEELAEEGILAADSIPLHYLKGAA
jgi:hypothetical protein